MKPQINRTAIALIAVALFFVALIVLPAISAYRALDRATHPPIKENTATPEKFHLEYEDVEIEVAGGKLSGWWIKSKFEQSPVVVLVHGFASNKRNMMPMARMIRKHGYNVLVYDARGHGDSLAGAVTFGDQESDDLLQVVEFAAQKGQVERVGIYGFSLGATTALLAATKNSERIGAIVSEGAFADPCAVVARMTDNDEGMVSAFVRPYIAIEAKLLFGIVTDPLQEISKIAVPVLMIHGKNDAVVPYEDAQLIDEKLTCRHKLWSVPRGKHGDAQALLPLEYQFEVVMFFNKSIGRLARLVDGDPFRPATATSPGSSTDTVLAPVEQTAATGE